MSTYFQTPEFPVISYQHTIASDLTISVTYNSNTFNSTLPAGDYWGFETNTSGFAVSGTSLIGALANAVQETLTDPAKHNFTAARVSGTQSWLTSPNIELIPRLTLQAGSPVGNIEVDIGANNNDFGSDGTSPDFTISQISLTGTGDFNSAGYWAPYNKTVYDERDYEDLSFGSEAISGDNTSVVLWGSQKTRRILTYPITYAAYIYSYRAGDSLFADAAQRDVNDPNNLLQALRDNVIVTDTNRSVRIYQSNGTYREGRIINSERLSNLNSWIEDISGRGQIWEVNIPMLDTGVVVNGAT